MADPATLKALLARVEAGGGADRELDAELDAALFGGFPAHLCDGPRRSYGAGHVHARDHGPILLDGRHAPPYLGSLDAAVALVNRVLAGWDWTVEQDGGKVGDVTYFAQVYAERPNALSAGDAAMHDRPAMALCAALLRALIATSTAPAARVEAEGENADV